ncbi:MAG: queuosine precursor transporter [Pseudomonadota bacterium]
MDKDERFPLLPVITGFFVCVLVLIPSTAAKFIAVGPFNIAGATLIFPIAFIFNDVLTEVYGYERSRRIIWVGFAAQVFAAGVYALIDVWPPASFWDKQAEYSAILGQAPRIVLASLTAYFCGEFINSYILSRMKYSQNGKRGSAQAVRFAASTFFGQLIDSSVFMIVGFYGVLANSDLLKTIVTIWLLKSAYEILLLPLSMRLSNWIKVREGIDRIDAPENTNYSPFKI